MNNIHYSNEAKKDLSDIISYIFEYNPTAAKETLNKIRKTIITLEQFKNAGVLKPEITNLPIRFLYYEKYVIAYNPDSEPIEIVRILSGERDLFDDRYF
jgi:plasmid stabilization system protein ParE